MASDPGHTDDWEANYEDLMAMEDSYGSGVEDLSSAAMEIANARMAEQKKLKEEMLKNRGIQPGDRVTVAVRVGAPYPERVKRYHYTTDPFGGEGLGHDPSTSGRRGGGGGGAGGGAPGDGWDEDDVGAGSRGSHGAGGAGTTSGAPEGEGAKEKRWKIEHQIGYVVRVRGEGGARVGVKRNGHPEDSDTSFPTYPAAWVRVLDVGEMWEIKTGPRNLGAFASDEDYAQAQAAWAAATATGEATRETRETKTKTKN
jgi:hypothetical protein